MTDEEMVVAIQGFFRSNREYFGEEDETEISPCPKGGFQISTRAGASFAFEITEPTRLAVAIAYFIHRYSVLEYILDKKLNGFWAKIFKRQARQKIMFKLDLLDNFADQILVLSDALKDAK